MTKNIHLQELVYQSLDIVNEAAHFIKSNLHNVTGDQVIEKGTNSLVSFVDQNAEKILIEGLSKVLPEAGFITEEKMVEQSQKQYTWIIDPLDGTTNFIHVLRASSLISKKYTPTGASLRSIKISCWFTRTGCCRSSRPL